MTRQQSVAAIAVLVLLLLAFQYAAPGTGGSRAQAQGAGFTVNSTADAVDANPGDGVCAAAGGQCTLRAAIMEANALSGADTITVPAGTYTLTIPGAGEDAAATGDLDLVQDITVNGGGAGSTIIQQSPEQGRVLEVIGDASVTLLGLTITHGNANVEPNAPCPQGTCAQFFGGGIYNSVGDLTLRGLKITDNNATSGGGIASYAGSLAMAQVSVTNNSASSFGGGLQIVNGQISQSLIASNTTGFGGGGIAMRDGSIENSTISGNSAEVAGSGLLASGSSAVSATTIAWNMTTGTAAAVESVESGNPAAATIEATLVANTAGGACGSGIVSGGHNIASDNTCSGFTAVADMTNTDPLLGPLADNGGPTMTHALLPGSPAIDTGDNGNCPATDQRGFSRPADGDGNGAAICDIGAYEASGAPPLKRGDIDCDGSVTSVDGLFLLRDVAHLSVDLGPGCPPIEAAAAAGVSLSAAPARGDMDCDGAITAVDALDILRHVALLPALPAPDGCPPIGQPL